MTDSRRMLVDGWADFAAQFHWQVYGHLTFRNPYSLDAAKKAVGTWLEDVGPGAYALVGMERGPAGLRSHCHVLLGGVRLRTADGDPVGFRSGIDMGAVAAVVSGRAWRYGNAQMQGYEPKAGGRWYVSKFPDDLELIGTPRRHRTRAKKPRQSPSVCT